MFRSVTYSIILHVLLFAAIAYSTHLSIAMLKARKKDLESLGAVQVDLTYKPTDTAMKQGPKEKDLPPPKVEEEKKEEEMVVKAAPKKPAKPEGKKPDLKSILEKIRKESTREENPRPKPKEDNFPTTPKGEKGAHGTGGRSLRAPTPAEQALQSAMRRHFELEDAGNVRKKFPNAVGYIQIKLVGVGSQFKLSGLQLSQSAGLPLLDRKCELAIREAISVEHFSADIIAELNGKEATITCKP